MKVNEYLTAARNAVSFPIEELTNFLYDGTKNTARHRWLRSLIAPEKEPILDTSDTVFLDREQRYVRNMQIIKRLLQIKKQHNLSYEDWLILLILLGEHSPILLHDSLFVGTLEGQMSKEQLDKWLPLAENYRIIGCYVQTEMGHGSNIKKLETTSTYIRESDEFELHSPTLTSMKWWPGSLARTSNYAVVMARLIIDKKDYGIHSFLVQLRGEGHKPLPGIEIGDIGPKLGYNNIDNGFLRFNKVRIPRTNMLMKFSKVSSSGIYSTPPHAKIVYNTLVGGRADIISKAAYYLAAVLTIAIRYSIIRKQGNKFSSQDEFQIIDYQFQQYKLFNGLARSYTFLFTGRFINTLYIENIAKMEKGDVSLMSELHAISSGLKALCAELVCESMEDARRCCGGSGYSSLSGIPQYATYYAQYPTSEGENIILYLQTGRYLLKSFQLVQQGKFTGGIQLSYLMDFDKILYKKFSANVKEEHILHPESQIETLRHRYIYLLSNLSSSLEKSSRIHPNNNNSNNNNNTLKEAEAKSEHMIDIINVSRAYCYFILLLNAHQGLQSVKKEHPSLYPSLRSLIDLFFINVVLSQFGEFLITGYYNSNHIDLLKNLQKGLLKKIRVDAIGLVDAWEFSDNMLNSALGRYDGNVYEEMYKRVKMDPLNLKHDKGIYVGYNEALKDIISGDYLKEIDNSERNNNNFSINKAKL
ncbi:hypothetical protein Glove_364g39 [Diversispora epigaea]|uniref:Acyl-coenzyme A oxidase n=1 Tax=Diversispora epigaea TaxID=1348612 RepID=A0A397H9F8_9GLOM|nr:hypothetical protein Glove_364g39 [Diversispora epigaea]